MIRSGQVHYLTGPEITTRRIHHLPGLCGFEPLRDGQAHALSCAYIQLVNCQNSCCARCLLGRLLDRV